MFKRSILGLACAMLFGASAFAQEAPQTVQDPSQGYLFNRFSNNWFVTGEGGVGVMFSKFDSEEGLGKRIAPAASIYVGKWFSPIIGLRLGGNYIQMKGLSEVPVWHDVRYDNQYWKQKFNEFGVVGDVMVNLTNWWCGYRPDRIYNSTVYFGGGAYWTTAYLGGEWKNAHNFNTSLRAGWINSFNVSKAVQLFLDVRFSTFDGPQETVKFEKKTVGDLQAYVGVTYNFNKRTWDAPVVPVCPEVPDCSAIEARLQAANARIADLERQLQDCLNRKPEVVEAEPEALATIYFPIGVSRLTREDKNIVNAVADVLKADASKKYDVKGYADTYTGSDAINNRLRNQRAGNVVKQLVSRGVSADQVQAVPVQGNLHGDNEALVSLDRCAVIIER